MGESKVGGLDYRIVNRLYALLRVSSYDFLPMGLKKKHFEGMLT